VASLFVAPGTQIADPRGAGQPQRRAVVATPAYAVPRAPAGVKEGQIWIPELPALESLEPPPGWQPSRVEQSWMPATLLRLPRTNIVRPKYPVIDFHLHAGNTTPALIQLIDRVGIAAEVNLNRRTRPPIDR